MPSDQDLPLKASSKVGLLGGTFDPLHNGHLAVARTVRDQLGLDQVLLIPAFRPPHKQHYSVTPFALRAAMIREALIDEPSLGLSLIEAETSSPSFSINTLERLAPIIGYLQSYFIIGADAFADIPLWKRFRDIPRLTNLVVVNRNDIEATGGPESVIRRHLPEFALTEDGVWRAAGEGAIVLLTMPPVEISSTLVRELASRGENISTLVPSSVEAMIVRHGLYRE